MVWSHTTGFELMFSDRLVLAEALLFTSRCCPTGLRHPLERSFAVVDSAIRAWEVWIDWSLTLSLGVRGLLWGDLAVDNAIACPRPQ